MPRKPSSRARSTSAAVRSFFQAVPYRIGGAAQGSEDGVGMALLRDARDVALGVIVARGDVVVGRSHRSARRDHDAVPGRGLLHGRERAAMDRAGAMLLE